MAVRFLDGDSVYSVCAGVTRAKPPSHEAWATYSSYTGPGRKSPGVYISEVPCLLTLARPHDYDRVWQGVYHGTSPKKFKEEQGGFFSSWRVEIENLEVHKKKKSDVTSAVVSSVCLTQPHPHTPHLRHSFSCTHRLSQLECVRPK